ncbi:hypothetical protein NP493_118g04023 [Ridgeia piscesae]|uniref:MPN domain-containing protein n=1 Tax=Ridgeia piscesae TaxID=27915 RepID=A0AAD9P6F6_RIDPI|nr:hypothetical protein NP493_118g04023 [Ridgeia piscesae]
MADITLSTTAYCKLLLHAAKYPQRAINGVLLAEKARSKDSKGLKVVDAIPLFHLTLGLAPMMEVALMQIDEYCKKKGLVIAGYYQANEHFKDSTPNGIAYRIAERIHDYYNEACLLMIDNAKLSLDGGHEALQVYTRHDTRWKLQECRDPLEDGATDHIYSLMQEKAYRKLVDFDNHLDNTSLDWKNLEINRELSI